MNKRTVMPIFNMRLAGFLMQKGFPLVNIKPDRIHPDKHVFFFAKSEELNMAMNKYLTNK